jgi:hypothetical protein
MVSVRDKKQQDQQPDKRTVKTDQGDDELRNTCTGEAGNQNHRWVYVQFRWHITHSMSRLPSASSNGEVLEGGKI